MNKEKRKRILSAIALCTASASLLVTASCGKPGGKKKSKIAVITKNKDVSFWEDVKNGAEAAGKELGFDILYTAATGDNDFSSQVSAINDAIDEKVDAIIIAPNGRTELNEALQKAEAADIKIININSRVEDYKGSIPLVSSSDYDGGSVAARYAADGVLLSSTIRTAMQQKGNNDFTKIAELGRGAVAIIPHTATTADNRVKGFKESTRTEVERQLKEDDVDIASFNVSAETLNAMFDRFFVVGEKCAKPEDARAEAEKILAAKDCNVKCFFTTNTNTTLGVCEAIEAAGKQDEIYVIGFNADEKELAFLKNNVLDGTVVQNPYNMGYVGVRFAKKAINGENVPLTLDTGVTWVDQNNMNEEYIQLLLHPENY